MRVVNYRRINENVSDSSEYSFSRLDIHHGDDDVFLEHRTGALVSEVVSTPRHVKGNGRDDISFCDSLDNFCTDSSP